MTDDLDPPGPDEQRAALRHIIGYRQLRRAIRDSGSSALVWGAVMLGLWYLAYWPNRIGRVVAVIHLALAIGELLTGVWKKLFPIPETFLLEAAVFIGFASANGYRVWEAQQRGAKPSLIDVGFGLYMLWAAVRQVQGYLALRRARFRRPGLAQLRWFDELLAETRAADPDADPHSLDLPTRPPLRVKLLGDTALALTPRDDDPAVVARADFRIDRVVPRRDERLPTGFVSIDGADAGDFPLDDANWRNYAAWKTAGGDPPPPLAARPSVA